jgi:exopolysaccharide biosynthesis WecB/TagA/CpsF family protein
MNTKLDMVDFLNLNFRSGELSDFRLEIKKMVNLNKKNISYVVTPNVDHIISIDNSKDVFDIYKSADMVICDSKILSFLANLINIRLVPLPGSDLTASLIEKSLSPSFTYAVIGPSVEDYEILKNKYPETKINHIESSDNLYRHSEEWKKTINRTMMENWDILFICLGHPKQEFFVNDLHNSGHHSGVVFCVGASIDFMTGKQARGPLIYQKLCLEWLFRLLSSPKRMFYRYVIRGPNIIPIYFKWLIKGGNKK